MSKPRLSDIQHLLENLILPFYLTERDMPIPIGKRRDENDAEHSWAVALMACSLAPEVDPTLDIGKVAQYAIIHDVVEIFAGDTSVWSDKTSLSSKADREKESFKRLEATFPTFPWVAETIQSYEHQDSSEARFVRAIDKIIAVYMRHLDKGKFYKEMKITKERFDRDMVEHRKKAQGHQAASDYYEELRALIDAFPEYFYVLE